jgi:2-polyprenyl-6-methoxyphenol hydroxylase-like FAD-dependent oxidoreductase
MSENNREQAVVLGAGIAGLLTAAALADEYTNVTVVDRDIVPTGVEHRRGTPHGRHTHGLLPRGVQAAEALVPGLVDELVARGARAGDVLANVRWHLLGRRLRQTPTALLVVSASRPLIEAAMRRRVLARPNVTLIGGYDVVGVAASPDRSRITAARVTSVTGDGSRVLPADLVVDATGRGSRAPRWLADYGYPAVESDRVTIDLAYATREFLAPPDLLGEDLAIVTTRYPGQRHGGVLQRIEGGRVIVTLAGVLGVRPPSDLDGFLAYAGRLAAPDIADALRLAVPASAPASFRLPTYVRHRYERLAAWPAGLVVIGDAACGFNPTYAQGMTVAAVEALALRDDLRRHARFEPGRFFATQAAILDPPWFLGVGADTAVAGVTGPRLPASPLTGEHVRRLQVAAADDAAVAAALVRVNSLVDPPSTLLDPALVGRADATVAVA